MNSESEEIPSRCQYRAKKRPTGRETTNFRNFPNKKKVHFPRMRELSQPGHRNQGTWEVADLKTIKAGAK